MKINKNLKIKLAVFFGGKSVEHEVSVISAIQAINFINKDKYEIIPIYITKENSMYTGELIAKIEEYSDIPALLKKSRRILLFNDDKKLKILSCPQKIFKNKIINTIDVAFPIVHGTNVEDGTFQGFLKFHDVPFVGSDVLGSAVGMDKFITKSVMKQENIPVLPAVKIRAKEFSLEREEIFTRLQEIINYPIIIKPVNSGSSVGIKVAKDREELTEAIEHALLFSNEIIAERAISKLKEVNVSVLGDGDEAIASECEEPVAKDVILSYNDKYISGKSGGKSIGMYSLARIIPANISDETREEIRTLAVKCFKALGCSGVARLDFMIDLDDNKIYFNEINTIPGSLAFYLWEPLGIKYPELLEKLINLAMKRERENSSVNFSFETNILKNAKISGSKQKNQK